MKNAAGLFFAIAIVLTGCASIPTISKSPPPRAVHADEYELGQPPKQYHFEDEGRDFNRTTTEENRDRLAHQRRLKQAEYEHKERLQQISHTAEEAKAAVDAGIQIAPPPVPQGTHGSVSDPTVAPTAEPAPAPQSNLSVGLPATVAFGVPAQQNFGGGVRGFFREWRYRFWDIGRVTTSDGQVWVGGSAGAGGSVRIPETSFERKVREYNGGSTFPSLATGVPPGVYHKNVLAIDARFVGAVQTRTGLDRVFWGR